MKYLIKSYKGINDFIFGSSIESIQKKYNVPFKTVQKKEITKLYSEGLSFTFENNQLMEISVIENNGVELCFDGYSLFQDHNIIQELQKTYPSIIKYGFYIFDSIGISFSGFEEKEGQRTITVYSPHYWDAVIK